MTRQTNLTLEKKKKFPSASAGIRTRNLSITSPALLPTNYPGVVQRSKAENISSCGTGQQDKYEREGERGRERETGGEREGEREREREREREGERERARERGEKKGGERERENFIV